MFFLLLQVSLVLVAIQNEALTQRHDGQHGLYVDYHGEYAGAYDNYKPRPYAFEYGVSDPHTGDHKTHWEMKDETGVVKGSYSLLESDGSTRTVDYVADHSGFRAIVKKIGNHGNVYSIENHGLVPSISPIHTSLHETEEGILQQHNIITETSPVENVPLYQSYNGEIKNYQEYPSEFRKQLLHSESYYSENTAQDTYHETESNDVEIHKPEQSGVGQNIFSEEQTIFNHKGGYSFNEQPQYAIVLPEAVETHEQQATHGAKLYGQPSKSNTDPLQYPYDINIPVRIYHENSHQNYDQVDEIYRDPLEQIWESQSANHNQLGRQPHLSSRSYGSNVVIHPHGESSQTFYGQTGNNQDDAEYTD